MSESLRHIRELAHPRLETERLILRPWREDDAEALFKYAKDPDIGHAAGWMPHHDLEESKRVIREVLSQDGSLAVVIKGRVPEDEPVGSIALKTGRYSHLARNDLQGEIGFWIGKPFWGKGYIPEAAREIIRYGFVDKGLEAIWGGNFSDNLNSARAQSKAGLTYHHTNYNTQRGVFESITDLNVNLLTRAEWELGQIADPQDEQSIMRQQAEAEDICRSLPLVSFIRSGGQTGADRAALDAGRALGIPICGWCPANGLAEDMPEPPGLLAIYPELVEGPSGDYVQRTAWNVRDSHATLVVAPVGLEPKSGTEMTVRFAKVLKRPCLVVKGPSQVDDVRSWLEGLGGGLTLNVAGPRESKLPGTYIATRNLIEELLADCRRK